MPLLVEAISEFLKSFEAPLCSLKMGRVVEDINNFPMDKRQTSKKGVSYTYKGHESYAPIAAYLSQKG